MSCGCSPIHSEKHLVLWLVLVPKRALVVLPARVATLALLLLLPLAQMPQRELLLAALVLCDVTDYCMIRTTITTCACSAKATDSSKSCAQFPFAGAVSLRKWFAQWLLCCLFWQLGFEGLSSHRGLAFRGPRWVGVEMWGVRWGVLWDRGPRLGSPKRLAEDMGVCWRLPHETPQPCVWGKESLFQDADIFFPAVFSL